MSKRVGFNVLAQKLKQRSRLKNGFGVIFSILFAFFSCDVSIYADGSVTSLQVNDVTTNIINVEKQKKATISGYIGAAGGGGTGYLLGYNEIRVISDDPAGTSGLRNLPVSQFTIVSKEGDPHNGMYYFSAKGRPFYNLNTSPYEYSVRVCLLSEDHAVAHCTGKISFSSNKKAASSSYSLSAQVGEPAEVGFYDIAEEDVDEEGSSCLSENGLIGHIFCPIVDGLQDAVSGIYESVIANSLDIPPELLNFDENSSSMSAGDSVREVWEYFRTLANIAFVLLLLVIVISQITGLGISNYGIKKLLPRVIASVILVNLSYLICQLAVDLSNILGQSIGDLIEKMAENVKIPAVKGAADGFGVLTNLATLVTIAAVGIGALVTNPALLIPVILALLSGLIAIFALFVTLGIRRAAVVVLIAVSPIAFVCYVLPNTKGIFNKWLNLFKALLLAFPIASIMVYGGLFAAKVLIATWGPTAPYSLLGGFAVSVAPYFFIPKVITSSLGKLNAVVAKVSNNLNRQLSRSVSQSGFAEGLQAKSNQKHLDYLAHYKPEVKHGPFKEWRNQRRAKYNSRRPASADRYVPLAMQGHKIDAEHEVRNANPNYIANSERNMRIKEHEEEYAANRYTTQQLGDMLDTAHQNGDDISRAAIMHTLSKSGEGIRRMETFLGSGIHSTEEMASIASTFTQKELDNMAHMSPFAAAVLDAAKRGENVGTGSMASFDLSKSGLSFNYSADYENYSDWTKAQLRANAEHSYDTDFSTQYTRAMEEMQLNPELKNNITLDSTESANDFLEKRNNEITSRASSMSMPSSFSVDSNALPSFMDGVNAGDDVSKISQQKAQVSTLQNDINTMRAQNTDGSFDAQIASARSQAMSLNSQIHETEKKVYFMGEMMKFAQKGDLIGMEAAQRQMDDILTSRLSGTLDQDERTRIRSEHEAFMSSAYNKISSPNFSFDSGVSRNAVAGQVSLFRSRQ